MGSIVKEIRDLLHVTFRLNHQAGPHEQGIMSSQPTSFVYSVSRVTNDSEIPCSENSNAEKTRSWVSRCIRPSRAEGPPSWSTRGGLNPLRRQIMTQVTNRDMSKEISESPGLHNSRSFSTSWIFLLSLRCAVLIATTFSSSVIHALLYTRHGCQPS